MANITAFRAFLSSDDFTQIRAALAADEAFETAGYAVDDAYEQVRRDVRRLPIDRSPEEEAEEEEAAVRHGVRGLERALDRARAALDHARKGLSTTARSAMTELSWTQLRRLLA